MNNVKLELDLELLVMKLIGNIEPAGDTSIDEDRLNNVEELIELIDKLMVNLSTIEYKYRDDRLLSRRDISHRIADWLKQTNEWLMEYREV